MTSEKQLHRRLCIQIVCLIVFLSITFGCVFSWITSWYAAYTAQKYARELNHMVETVSQEIYSADISDGSWSKQTIQTVKKNLRQQSYTGILFIYNSSGKLIYQYESKPDQHSDQTLEYCEKLLNSNSSSGYEQQIHHSGQAWCMKLFSLPVSSHVRGQYFISGASYPDLSIFQREGLLFFSVVSLLILFLCYPILTRNFRQAEEQILHDKQLREQYFQNISHDLKTPLAAITGFAQGIACGVIEDPQKAAEIILKESLRMTDFVESILSLSKMENKEFKVYVVEIELKEFMEECIESLQELRKNCRLQLSTGHDPVYIHTDAELLKRIIYNLLSNSMKYAKSTVDIAISHSKGIIRITISDDGAGFPEKELPHVFERFYHGSKDGNGIGLAIVSTGIRYLGGTITAGNLPLPRHGAIYQLQLPEYYPNSPKN